MEEWILIHLSPDMPLVRPVLCRGQTRLEEWILTHLSPDMPLVQPVVVQAIGPGWRPGHPLVQVQRCPLVQPVLARGQTRMQEWIPTHLSSDMRLVRLGVVQAIGPGWRPGHPLVRVQRCPLVRPVLYRGQTRMEEWIPTHLSPDMPLVRLVMVQAISPGWRGGHPLVQVQRCPLVRPVLGRGQTRMEEWIPTHLSPDMPLVRPVVVQAIGPGWRPGHPLVQVQRCPLVRPVLYRGQTRMEEWITTHLSPDMPPGLTSSSQAGGPDGGVDIHSP